MTREFPPPDARLEGKVKIFQFSAQRDVLGVASSDGHDTGGGKASWRDNSFSAKDLQTMAFPPLAWIVPNIIPAEGVTLLCSKPKFGKSWFALDLVIACTTDRFTLGETKPMQGDVLYLALEDSKRRLQRRTAKLLPTFNAKWPERLTIKTDWRRLHEGGLDDIRAWHDDRKTKGGKPILVVVDVLAKVRRPVGNRQLYEADYEALAGLTALANKLGTAILVLHHTRKMAADDLMETVSGSYGVAGAVDTILVMATNSSGAVLDVRGRDVEAAELAIQFEKSTCRWRILGNAADVHISEQRSKIIATLKEASAPMTIGALVEATGMKRNALEVLLGRMVKDGAVLRVAKGVYATPDYVPPPDDNPSAKGAKDKSRRSVSPSAAATDGRQMPRGSQHIDVEQESPSICLSVASVRQSANAIGADDARGPSVQTMQTQTDRTDRQIDAQGADSSVEVRADDLSGGLPDGDRSTDKASARQLMPYWSGSTPKGRATLPTRPVEEPKATPRPPSVSAPPHCDHCKKSGGDLCKYEITTADGKTVKVILHVLCKRAFYEALGGRCGVTR